MAKTTNNKFRFYRVRNVNTPIVEANSSAIDLFVPWELTANEMSAKQKVKGQVSIVANPQTGIIQEYILPPKSRIVIPTGLKVDIPVGKCGLIVDKAKIATATGLTIISNYIDNNSFDEIFVNIVNTSDTPVKIQPGKKIAQLILIDVNVCELEEVSIFEDLYKNREEFKQYSEEKIANEKIEQKAKEESIVNVKPAVKTSVKKTNKKEAIKFDDNVRLSEEQLRKIEADVENNFNPNIFA